MIARNVWNQQISEMENEFYVTNGAFLPSVIVFLSLVKYKCFREMSEFFKIRPFLLVCAFDDQVSKTLRVTRNKDLDSEQLCVKEKPINLKCVVFWCHVSIYILSHIRLKIIYFLINRQ